MARGFQYAPGASDEVVHAREATVLKGELPTLAQSKNAVVRETVAGRLDIPIGVMATLAHDRSVDVRCALASNPHVTSSVLEHLAGDRHVEVVLAVLGNASTPMELVSELASHRKPAVRDVAEARLAAPTSPPAPSVPLTTTPDSAPTVATQPAVEASDDSQADIHATAATGETPIAPATNRALPAGAESFEFQDWVPIDAPQAEQAHSYRP
ncbi:hypothetical protein [Demequina sediminicola]|uniref:hypothetical protein n=1 Tax=Demequina sediminicola TaxID=1095026 RepID=UPI0007863BBC|nr:hypothetical protein [Demequina sediminicola]